MARKATTKKAQTTAAVTEAPVEAAVETKAEVEAEVKAEVKEEAAPEEAEKKAARKGAVKKATETVKSAAEKVAKATKKAIEPTTSAVFVQYMGKEIVCKDVVAAVKEIWTKEMGNKESDLKDIKVYIKPEDNGAYYVLNGDVTGFIGL